MKHLMIKLGDTVLFDGEVAEVQWCESAGEVSVKGTVRRKPSGGGSSALLEMLAGAAKAKRGEPVPAEPEVFEPAPPKEVTPGG